MLQKANRAKHNGSKPQIYDEILHHSNGGGNGKNSQNNKRSRRKSMAQMSKSFNFRLKDNFQFDQKKQQNNNAPIHQQSFKPTTFLSQPSWPNNSFPLFSQRQMLNNNKISKIFDQLEQIGLSQSKRMPNFLDKYGMMKGEPKKIFNKNLQQETNFKRLQQQQAKRSKATEDNLINNNSKNRLYKSQISPVFNHHFNDNNHIEISQSSSSNNVNDDSLIIIQQQDYKKSFLEGSHPRKKIFLNQEYKEVSVNVSSEKNQVKTHQKQQNLLQQQKIPGMSQSQLIDSPKKPLQPSDPRFIHRAKIAGQNLFDFLSNVPLVRKYRQSPLDYIKYLKNKTKNQIQKKGICVDLQQLQRRQTQRNWHAEDYGEQEVWVVDKEKDQPKKQPQIGKKSQNIIISDKRQQIATESQQSLSQPHQKFSSSQLSVQKSLPNNQSNSTKPSQSQQSADFELISGLQQDIEQIFKQRYPQQPITKQIKEQINKIVKKVAYENMEMEEGLKMIDQWVEEICHRIKTNELMNKKTNHKNEQDQNQTDKDTTSEHRKLGSKAKDCEVKTLTRELQLKNSHTSQSNVNKAKLHSVQSQLLPKPTRAIQQTSIVTIIEQFEYKGQRCFKLLLSNNQKVNVHYLELKRNCPKLLFDYFEVKCQQFQKQFIVKGNTVM